MNDLTPIEMDEFKLLQDADEPAARRCASAGPAGSCSWLAAVALAWLLLRGGSAPAAAPALPVVTVADAALARDHRMGRVHRPLRGEPQRRAAPARLGPGHRGAFPGRPARRARASRCSRSTRAPTRPRWPRRRRASPPRGSDLALARSDLDRAAAAGRGRCRGQERDRRARGACDRRQCFARRRARRGSARAASTWSSPRCARRSAAASPTAGSTRATSSPPATAPPATLLTTIVATDPLYFAFDGSEGLFLKSKRERAGAAAPGADPPAGRDRLQVERPARLHRQRRSIPTRARSAPARWSATRTTSSPPACSATCAWRAAAPSRRCWCPTPRCRPTRRASCCWSSAKDGTVARQGSRARPGHRRRLRVVRGGLEPGRPRGDRRHADGHAGGTRVTARAGRIAIRPRSRSRRGDRRSRLPARRRSPTDSRRTPPTDLDSKLEPEMRLSRFFIDRPIFAAVIARDHHARRRDLLLLPAGLAVSRGRPADGDGDRHLSRRLGRDRGRHRRQPDRAGDQRRRRHALPCRASRPATAG